MKTKQMVTLGLTLCAPLSYAGTGSHGVDTPTWQNDEAWFLTSKGSEFTYCIDVDPKFDVSAGTLEVEIQNAIRTWKNYVTQKDIKYDGRPAVPVLDRIVFAGRSVGPCTTKNETEVDLAFYFGAQNNKVKEASKNFNKPIGMAIKPEHSIEDSNPGWTKGFIWITNSGSLDGTWPKWSDVRYLRGILTHELGHVFGCAHVKGTIMDETFVFKAADGTLSLYGEDDVINKRRRKYLTQIDGNHELYPMSAGLYINDQSFDTTERLRKVIKQVLNREPRTGVYARTIISREVHSLRSIDLTIGDSEGYMEFTVNLDFGSKFEVHDQAMIFRTAEKETYDVLFYESATFVGQAKLPDGTDLVITVRQNNNDYAPIYIDGFLPGTRDVEWISFGRFSPADKSP